jgi:4-hydroxy-4-methyl-2-oxoglutarate aldolase
MNLANAIIDKIKRNRISTSEITDCLNKSGAIPNIFPLNKGHFIVGKVFWVYAYNESNWEVQEQLRDIPENQIVLVEAFDCKDRAIFGQLVSKYLILYRQATGIIVRGNLRDIPHLLKENWPIWSEGSTPVGCFNLRNKLPFDPEIIRQRQNLYNDSIAVCDDSGVAIIPKEFHNEEFLQKLDWIEEQEDIWFDCIDRRKWDTFETVCLKKYLEKSE